MSLETLHDQLINAIFDGNTTSVIQLLDAGANINGVRTAPKGWWTPLGQAAEQENCEIIRLLVERGAEVNLRNEYGYTPLHFAIDVAIDGTIQANRDLVDWTCVKLLLSLGADPSIKDNKGESAFQVPSSYGSRVLLQFNDFLTTINSPELTQNR